MKKEMKEVVVANEKYYVDITDLTQEESEEKIMWFKKEVEDKNHYKMMDLMLDYMYH